MSPNAIVWLTDVFLATMELRCGTEKEDLAHLLVDSYIASFGLTIRKILNTTRLIFLKVRKKKRILFSICAKTQA